MAPTYQYSHQEATMLKYTATAKAMYGVVCEAAVTQHYKTNTRKFHSFES